eukprot:s2273_g3.t1
MGSEVEIALEEEGLLMANGQRVVGDLARSARAVQRARLFPDSKQFVDMPLKNDPEAVLAEFEKLEDKTDKATLMDFVSTHFAEVGSRSIQDPTGRFLETYYWDTYWVVRGLIVCNMLETAKGVDLVRNFGFVPNGTRVYYLDRSQPPLLTDMAMAIFDATGDKEWLSKVLPLMVKEYNFWMCEDSGHVVHLKRPSGMLSLNIYQSQRRGPRPDLQLHHAAWLWTWIEPTTGLISRKSFHCADDQHFDALGMSSFLPCMFMRLRLSPFASSTARSKQVPMFEESYIEDLETAISARMSGLEPDSREVFRGLCSGAESGWDFTTRWMDDSDEDLLGQARRLCHAARSEKHCIIPVDLNCLLLRVWPRDGAWGKNGGFLETTRTIVEKGLARAHELVANMDQVLWNDEMKCYSDYRMDKGRVSKVVALSNWAAPLWAGLHGPQDALRHAAACFTFLRLSLPFFLRDLQMQCAVSVQLLCQEVDKPKFLQSLETSLEHQGCVALAKDLAERWLSSCEMSWESSGFMYEKYNAAKPGEGGGGGEYEPQAWGVEKGLRNDCGSLHIVVVSGPVLNKSEEYQGAQGVSFDMICPLPGDNLKPMATPRASSMTPGEKPHQAPSSDLVEAGNGFGGVNGHPLGLTPNTGGHALRLALARELMDEALAQERWQEALVFAREVCSCQRQIYPAGWPVVALSLARLAKLEFYHGNMVEALRCCEDAHSGTGPATTTVAETAHAIEKQGLAKITKLETGYPAVGGQSAARLAVTLTTDWPYPDPSSYSTMTHFGATVEKYILISFEKGILQGAIELHLLGVQETERMVLDTRSLDIKSITVDGAPGEYQLGTKGRKSEALGEALEEQTQGKKHPYLFTQCQAIHARCLMPCQDTPGVKSKYTAKITAPSPLTVLMSAVPDGEPKEVEGGKRCFSFTQKVPIPSYLLALACGNLASRRVGPRSHVWSEPEAVEACAFEFSDTEKFLALGEKLFGEYVWGIYDLLVLPPSFPYGGMENPCLTFVTPTLLAGDRSLADVERFEAYLRAHVKRFAGGFLTEEDFKNFFLEHFSSEPAVQNVDWQKWFYGSGLPELPTMNCVLAEKVELLFSSLKGGYEGSKEDIDGWFPKQIMLLLDRLVDYAREQAAAGKADEVRQRLSTWSEAYGFETWSKAQ